MFQLYQTITFDYINITKLHILISFSPSFIFPTHCVEFEYYFYRLVGRIINIFLNIKYKMSSDECDSKKSNNESDSNLFTEDTSEKIDKKNKNIKNII